MKSTSETVFHEQHLFILISVTIGDIMHKLKLSTSNLPKEIRFAVFLLRRKYIFTLRIEQTINNNKLFQEKWSGKNKFQQSVTGHDIKPK